MKPDAKYLWKYVCGKGRQAAIKNQRFMSIERCGVPQSDWVSGSAWCSPVAIFVDEVCYE